VVRFTTRPLYPLQENRLRYPFDRRLGGPQSPSGHGGEENKITAPARDHSTVQSLQRWNVKDALILHHRFVHSVIVRTACCLQHSHQANRCCYVKQVVATVRSVCTPQHAAVNLRSLASDLVFLFSTKIELRPFADCRDATGVGTWKETKCPLEDPVPETEFKFYWGSWRHAYFVAWFQWWYSLPQTEVWLGTHRQSNIRRTLLY
jgi:hypothetical protein